MALRKLREYIGNNDGCVAKIYHDAEWQEYRVTFYLNGVRLLGASYHTDDRNDAISTAQMYVNKSKVI